MALDLARTGILVVDDDDSNTILIERQLNQGGFTNVATASSGKEALDSIAACMPDLILLDVMMPDMNGYTVTQEIRARYPTVFLPIILVSALQRPEDRVKGLDSGANDFMSKPYNVEELLARVSSLLALKSTRDELDAERERLALLYDISRTISAQLDYRTLMREIASLTTTLTGAAKTLLVILDDAGHFKEKIVARAGLKPISADKMDPLILDQGLTGWVIRNRRSALIPDVTQDPRWARLPDETEEVAAAAAVPLMRGERIVGVLVMTSPDKDAFDANHLNLLMAIASQAAVTLENARLYQAARQQQARIVALFNQSGNPVLIANADGFITDVNASAAELELPQPLHKRHLSEVFGMALADLVRRAQERGSPVSGAYTMRLSSGESRTYNVSISPIEQVGFMLIWQDITSIKESEQIRLQSERAETQRVLEAWTRYMSPALVERVLSDRDIIERKERREALVLFADLRGFTRLTVQHPPDAVLALLNDVFAEMMEIVYKYEGVIFDIAGDELMIAFNVPYNQPDACDRALSTAIAMQRRFATLKAIWAARGMEIGMGIGINRGMVVLGHVGGRTRMNYAMVGEPVNIAHRLVEVARDAQIVITPEVLSGLRSPLEAGIRTRELPPQFLKGKDKAQSMLVVEPMPQNASS